MDYLQYKSTVNEGETVLFCFKPYYKWITFNILDEDDYLFAQAVLVLNLIINGLPSIFLIF